ncbi:hypothetical protein EJ110_NYTH52301 [Nymphaea thermarum]|nr:hypothetical protein EJ110_NYTH52301 [Nymphaea thermarum]
MLTNSKMPHVYFVALKGISVGGKRLQIPDWVFQIDQTGTGGFFVDSGSRYMCLLETAYSQVLGAFAEALGLPIVGSPIPYLSACFEGLPGSMSIPSLTLHFQNGDLHLPLENYFVVVKEDELSCLAIIRTPFGGSFSVIGTITVQNIHVNYNVGKSLMTFTPTQCDKL